MKFTDLFWRGRKRTNRPDDIAAPARLGKDRLGEDRLGKDHLGKAHLGKEVADRSSMADLVRLLKEADEAQNSGRQPA